MFNRQRPTTLIFDKMMGVGNHYGLHLSWQQIFSAEYESEGQNTNESEQIFITDVCVNY